MKIAQQTRDEVVRLYSQHVPIREIMRRFEVSRSSIYNFLKFDKHRFRAIKQNIPTTGNPEPGCLYRSGEIRLSKTIVDNFASISNGGEGGIGTLDRAAPSYRPFSWLLARNLLKFS